MDALNKKHKIKIDKLKRIHLVDANKYKKLIVLGEARLSDERSALQKAAEKDKRAAFWKGLVWGGGGTLAVILIGTAVVVIYYVVTTWPTKTQSLVLSHNTY